MLDKLPSTVGMIFESGRAYVNYKKDHPEYVDDFWKKHTQHWWERL